MTIWALIHKNLIYVSQTMDSLKMGELMPIHPRRLFISACFGKQEPSLSCFSGMGLLGFALLAMYVRGSASFGQVFVLLNYKIGS